MEQPADLVILGRIGAAYGTRGWVKLISFTDPAENILRYRRFYLGSEGRAMQAESRRNRRLGEIEIDASRSRGKGFIGHIRGCDDRRRAQDHHGRDLLVEKSALPPLRGADYYWHQLEGLAVMTLRGEYLGKVHHLLATGANDVLVVRGDDNGSDERERLIPYIFGQVIESIDLERQLMHVAWEKDF